MFLFMGWGNSRYPSNWNSIRKDILERDGYQCTECGTSKEQLHVHHITPVSEGGSHSPKNLRTLCHSCHEDIHGHRIPTKQDSEPSLTKKMLWAGAWESDTTGTNEGWKKIFESILHWFSRTNSKSDEIWYAKILAVPISYLLISLSLSILDSEFITLNDPVHVFIVELFIAPIAVFVVFILASIIPALGIPLTIGYLIYVTIIYGMIYVVLSFSFSRWL